MGSILRVGWQWKPLWRGARTPLSQPRVPSRRCLFDRKGLAEHAPSRPRLTVRAQGMTTSPTSGGLAC